MRQWQNHQDWEAGEENIPGAVSITSHEAGARQGLAHLGQARGAGNLEPQGKGQGQPVKACPCPVCPHRCLPAVSKPAWLPGPEPPAPNPSLCSTLILPMSAHRQPGEPLKHINPVLFFCFQCSSGFPSYQTHRRPSMNSERRDGSLIPTD